MTASPVILLGAGASAAAGLPLATEMTKRMLDRHDEAASWQLSAALNYVVGSIVGFDAKHAGARPDQLPDIERVVSAVELLSNRDALEVTPFVLWDESVTAREMSEPKRPSSLQHREFERAITVDRKGALKVDGRAMQKAVQRLVDARATPRNSDVYNALHQSLIRALDDLLKLREPSTCDFLVPLLGPGNDAPKVVVTLNYDLTVETASASAGRELTDGVRDWSRTGRLRWSRDALHLVKLHGSLAWGRGQSHSGHDVLKLPQTTLVERTHDGDLPFLIFGRREKLRAEGPFLQLLEYFRQSLAATDLLIVIGYAFRDDHVNGVITQWVNSDAARRLVVVDPYFPEPGGWGTQLTTQQLWLDCLLERESSDPLGTTGAGSRLRVYRQTAVEFLAAAGSDFRAYVQASSPVTAT